MRSLIANGRRRLCVGELCVCMTDRVTCNQHNKQKQRDTGNDLRPPSVARRDQSRCCSGKKDPNQYVAQETHYNPSSAAAGVYIANAKGPGHPGLFFNSRSDYFCGAFSMPGCGSG